MSKELILRGKWARGRVSLVDDEDHPWLSAHSCRVTKNGYVATSIRVGDRYREVCVHRLIMEKHHGPLGKRDVDHIHGDRLDNRKTKLRLTDHQGNARNAKSASPNKTSRHKGVSKRRKGAYVASITVDGVSHNLGVYSSEQDAAAVYDLKAQELFGEFARVNGVTITSETEQRLRALMGDPRLRNGYASRYPGVSPSGKTTWRARIGRAHLGTFKTQEEAADACARYRKGEA